MTQPKNSDTAGKPKMSEMISEMAAGFISAGQYARERQNRLNAACTAWNMACGSPEVRQRQLEQYQGGLRAFQPWDFSQRIWPTSSRIMESLIERKLKMFPDDHRQIVMPRSSWSGTPTASKSHRLLCRDGWRSSGFGD